MKILEIVIPDQIEINGQLKYTKNSNGKLIHPTIDGIKNFWIWFQNSKVVDNIGRPLVLYHGTTKNFNQFNIANQGDTFAEVEINVPRDGFWFTSDPQIAHVYSNYSANSNRSKSGQRTIPVYLKIQNPYVYDMETYYDNGVSEIPQEFDLKSKKYDGMFVEIPHEQDEMPPDAEEMWQKYTPIYGAPYAWPKDLLKQYDELLDQPLMLKEMNYVVFQPNQIKSSIGNNGQFSNNTDINSE